MTNVSPKIMLYRTSDLPNISCHISQPHTDMLQWLSRSMTRNSEVSKMATESCFGVALGFRDFICMSTVGSIVKNTSLSFRIFPEVWRNIIQRLLSWQHKGKLGSGTSAGGAKRWCWTWAAQLLAIGSSLLSLQAGVQPNESSLLHVPQPPTSSSRFSTGISLSWQKWGVNHLFWRRSFGNT